MATRKGNFLKGSIGPVTLREVNGKQIVSKKTAPGTMQQTEATKKAAKTFGIASAFSSHLRQRLAPWIKQFHDSGMVNRVTTAILKCLIPCRNNGNRIIQIRSE